MGSIRKRTFFLIYCLLLLAMVGTTTVLLRQTNEEAENRQAIQQDFQSLLRLDLSLNESVLRTRASLFENYDQLSSDIQGLFGTCGKLLNSNSAFMRTATPSVIDDLISYCNEVKTKIELAKRFKSENEILRNSLSDILETAGPLEGTPSGQGALKLETLILERSFSPSPASERQLQRQMKNLKTASAHDPKIKKSIAKMTAESKLLLQKAGQREDLEKQMLASNVSDALKRLETSYQNLLQEQERPTRLLRIGLAAFCFLLIGSQILLFGKLLKAGANLSLLNKTLEFKVQERTAALSDALNRLNDQQQLLVQSTKMTALGEMAGGMAHEINTPLAAITLNAELLLEQGANPEAAEVTQLAQAILRVTQRISKIVTGLRKFSRNSAQDEKVPARVTELVEDTLSFCQEKFIKAGIRLTVQCSAEHSIICSPEQICQVLLNLLHNAYDAIQDLDLREKWVRIDSRLNGDRVEIRVTDCGPGIPAEIRTKMLQPFFTTKEIGKGTGLGLSISTGIAQNHGGSLSYDESSAHTCFVVSLPEAKSSATTAA